jgi:hypothetical protein
MVLLYKHLKLVLAESIIVASMLYISSVLGVVSFCVFLNNFFFLHDAGFCAARFLYIFTYARTWCSGLFG